MSNVGKYRIWKEMTVACNFESLGDSSTYNTLNFRYAKLIWVEKFSFAASVLRTKWREVTYCSMPSYWIKGCIFQSFFLETVICYQCIELRNNYSTQACGIWPDFSGRYCASLSTLTHGLVILFFLDVCDHLRTHGYYTASVIGSCSWAACLCVNYATFKAGRCLRNSGACMS